MTMYKLVDATTLSNKHIKGIKRLSDDSFIPMDEANTDYQKYLAWVAAGNTPEPADEVQNS